MSGRSSRQWHRRRQPIVFLAMVCVVVLVAAAQIEVAHFCQLATVTAGRHASARGSEATAPSICLICATAHQASMGTAHTPAAPSFAVIASAAPVAAQPQSRLHVFNLDVRPPPALAL